MNKNITPRSIIDMSEKDIVLAINDVEAGLVKATTKLSSQIKRKLYGIVLIDETFVDYKNRVADKTGFFKEVICDFNDPLSVRLATETVPTKASNLLLPLRMGH
jgi:predicted methyltransferase